MLVGFGGSKSVIFGIDFLMIFACRSKSGPRAAKSGQERPKSSQERPKSGQKRPKSGPRAAKRAPRVAKSAPRAAQEQLRGAKFVDFSLGLSGFQKRDVSEKMKRKKI